jgi:HD-GYP domain-containing protein (c-di-GMP phosphodiesterase class II)
MEKRKWSVHAAVHGSKYIGEFEASTAEEAKRLAKKHADVCLCNKCASEVIDPEVVELFVDLVEEASDA